MKSRTGFSGVRRRFDIRLENERCIYIDDYAHHPREIAASLTSIRGNYPGRKLTAIFQPHLYTRTRDFAEGFTEALSHADRLILLDIYPAREEPIPGVTSEIIFDGVSLDDKVLLRKEELMRHLESLEAPQNEVYMTIGAGDIDRFVEPLAELLKKRTE